VSETKTREVSEELTDLVFKIKVVEVAPAGTNTVAGTVMVPGTPTDTFTSQPPLGAGDLSVIVPVDEVPPFTLEGFNVNPAIESPFTVSNVDLVVTPSEP